MEFLPMKAEHAALLKDMIGVHAEANITPELAAEVERSGAAMTAMHDGEVLGIAGVTEKWAGTGVAWAWLSRKWRRYARSITQEMVKNLEAAPYKRIEMAVRFEFVAGHKWAKHLGFKLETPFAQGYGPDGKDYSVYVRLQHG